MYRALYWLMLRHLPAEATHKIAFALLRALLWLPGLAGWLRRRTAPVRPALQVQALGHTFPSPLGLAAGFDKDGKGPRALHALGFGHVEIGTVTGEAQPGNPKPRLFRLVRDRAVLNRMGFNNQGAAVAQARLAQRRGRHGLVGVNIGKTKRVDEAYAIADYEHSARLLAPHADYMVVNVSSPNTPGLRDLQAVEKLAPLLRAVRAACDAASPLRRVPLLVKIAPDLSDEDIVAVGKLAVELELDGIIATNTTIARTGLQTPAAEVAALGAGGISGPPVAARSLAVLRLLRAHLPAKMCIISVGGISTGADVLARLQAGATLVQGYTAFIYGGPGWPRRVLRELETAMQADGVAAVANLVPAQQAVAA